MAHARVPGERRAPPHVAASRCAREAAASMGLDLRHVPRDVFAIVGRYPVAALLPAAALGAASDALQLWEMGVASEVLFGLVLAVAFELYVAYAERLVIEALRGADRVAAT